jgi:DNA-binding transcriptional LysR family regulator
MDWSALATFVGVARCGSFARFARQQALAPSSVSRAIDALERELGVRLFQRTTRKLAATEAGERLLSHVEPLLNQLDLVRSVARGTTAEAAGTLRVTAPVAFGQLVLGPLLIEFARTHPEITLHVVLNDEVLSLVEERIDVALRLGKLADSTLIVRRLGRPSYVTCASPAYLAKRSTPRRPEELQQHDCLRYLMPGVRSSWYFRSAAGVRTEVAVHGPISINNGVALRACALAGLGITVLPRWNVEQDLAQGTLVRLFPKHETSASDLDADLWLVLPSRRQIPAKVRAFTDFMSAKLRAVPSLFQQPSRERSRRPPSLPRGARAPRTKERGRAEDEPAMR